MTAASFILAQRLTHFHFLFFQFVIVAVMPNNASSNQNYSKYQGEEVEENASTAATIQLEDFAITVRKDTTEIKGRTSHTEKPV